VTNRDDHITVDYLLRGTVSEYRRKVYGRNWDGTVSPEDLEETHEAWDIRETYDRLWTLYEDSIQHFDVDAQGVNLLMLDYALVVNTIPLNVLCAKGHQFRYTEVVAAGDAPALGIDVGRHYRCPQDTVILNGEEMPTWYRISNIFGHTTIEWPQGIKPPLGTASIVVKPTETNCDCWPDMLKLGRYGSWSKGVLSHTAYDKTIEGIENGPAAQADSYNDPNVPTLF
jgi:hypothetical protein